MEMFSDFGITATDWKAKQRQRVKDMIRKAQERAKAHRPVLTVTDVYTRPKRVVFQTPHGPAYIVEKSERISLMPSGGARQSITLPYIAGYTE